MNARLVFSYEKKFPSELHYWFVNEEDKIRLFSNAIKTPEIYVSPSGITIKGDWVYQSGQTVVKRSGEEKEEEDEANEKDLINYPKENVVDYAYVGDALMTIEKTGDTYYFSGDKFTGYDHKYGFITLEKKDKIIILTNGKQIEREKPLKYRVLPSFINLVYQNESVVYDIDGRMVARFKKPLYYLGKTSKGILFQVAIGESSGKIMAEKDPDMFTYCSGESALIGESQLGIVISCNKQLKYYSDGAWTAISKTTDITSSFANSNFIIVTDSETIVYPGDSITKPLFTVRPMHTVYADRKYIYFLSEPKKFYVVEAAENYQPFLINRDEHNMVILTIDKALYPSLKLGKRLIQIKEREEGDKVIIRLEPSRLSAPVQSKIEINNEIIEYTEEIKIAEASVVLEPIEAYILVSEGGRVKNAEGNYNALLRLRVNYEIPTKLKSFLKVKVQGREYSFPITKMEDDVVLDIPLIKADTRDEMIIISLERNGYTEASKEFPVKVKEVIKSTKNPKPFEVIEDATRKVVKKTEEGLFEWVKVWEYPDPYDNVVITKAGNIISIEGEKFEVIPGIHEFTVNKKGYKRHYIIYGIESPLRGIKASVNKNELYIEVSLDYKAPVTVIYGTYIQTSNDGKFVFPFDPFHSTIIVKIYYSETIKWEYVYQLNGIDRLSVKNALYLSKILEDEFEDKGVFTIV